jgi:hypothetical protein
MSISSDGIINMSAAANLWAFSGQDGVVNYWIDRRGIGQLYGLPVSRQEARYINKTFQFLDDITGLTFQKVRSSFISDIDIHCVSRLGRNTLGITKTMPDRFDVLWQDSGGNRVSSTEKWVIPHEIGHAVGLGHPYSDGFNPFFNRADTIMSYNRGGSFFTDSDRNALQVLWGL